MSTRVTSSVVGKEIAAASTARRSYLSRVWGDEEEEARRAMRKWWIPLDDRNNLKEHLRMWARTVATAVQ
jgi:hypothetical protein